MQVAENLRFIEFHDGKILSIRFGGNDELEFIAEVYLHYYSNTPNSDEVWLGEVVGRVTGLEAIEFCQGEKTCWDTDGIDVVSATLDYAEGCMQMLNGFEIQSIKFPFQLMGSYLEICAAKIFLLPTCRKEFVEIFAID